MAQQPPAQQPPAPPPPPPIPGQPAAGQRPASATTAAILLFTVGILRGILMLIGLIAIIGASGEIAGLEGAGAFIGIFVVVVLIGIAAAVLQIMGGVQTLQLRARGFALGLTGTIIGLVLGVLSLAGTLGGSGQAGSAVIVALLLIGDVVILIYLGQARRFMTSA
jgi:hypothetical protein